MDVRLNFATLADLAPIGSQYASEGLTFSENAVAVRDRNLGGRGNFNLDGADNTLITYGNGEAIEVGIANTLPAIVSGQLTLRYTSPHVEHAVRVLDASGNEIDRFTLPRTLPNFSVGGEFDNFQTLTFDFNGNARSLHLGSFANQLGIDDLSLTFDFAGEEPEEPSEPEEPTNAAPTDITLSNNSLSENSAPNTLVGVLSTRDPDADDTHTYTLLDSADGSFRLEGDRLLVADNSNLDFETNPSFTVTVRTTDPEGLSLDVPLTIQLEDVEETQPNAAPTDILTDPSTLSLSEDAPQGTILATLSALDPDGDTPLSFTLLDDAQGQFALNENQLVLVNNSLIDFETVPELSVIVRVTDPGGLSYEETVPIRLTDANENPIANDDTLGIESLIGTLGDDTLTYGEIARIFVDTDLILSNDRDPEGDSLSVVAVGDEIGGDAVQDTLAAEITFTPDEAFESVGSAQFSYTVSDSAGGTARATVTLFDSAPQVQDARAGNDILVLNEAIAVDLSQTEDQTPNDTLRVVGFENVFGSPGDDTLSGDAGANLLFGDAGNDSLSGGENNDELQGGVGDDSLIGGLGNDNLAGGAGSDRFVFNSPDEGLDTLVDFDPSFDRIAISASGFSPDFEPGELDFEGVEEDEEDSPTEPEDFNARFVWQLQGQGIRLFFDSDGDGDAPPIPLADIPTLSAIRADSFVLF